MRGGGGKREERVSIGIVRGRTCLYYTKGTDGGTRRPRDLPLMMLYSRLSRSLVSTRRFALLRSTFSRTGCVYRPRTSRLCSPLRSGGPPCWRRGDPDEEGIGAIVKRSIITGSLRASLLHAFYALLFLIRHIVIAIKINSCSRVTG